MGGLNTLIIVAILILFVWEVVVLPKYVEKKITSELNEKGYEVADLTLISRRDSIYSVSYLKADRLSRDNVKYGLFGHIKWI